MICRFAWKHFAGRSRHLKKRGRSDDPVTEKTLLNRVVEFVKMLSEVKAILPPPPVLLASVIRLGNLLDFGQLFKAFGNN